MVRPGCVYFTDLIRKPVTTEADAETSNDLCRTRARASGRLARVGVEDADTERSWNAGFDSGKPSAGCNIMIMFIVQSNSRVTELLLPSHLLYEFLLCLMLFSSFDHFAFYTLHVETRESHACWSTKACGTR